MQQAFAPVYESLGKRRFFKLICGGSFSDTHRLKQLIQAYAATGIQMIDISADANVVAAASEALAEIQDPPMLMVSFPLDNDPHFRKIQLSEPDCINCGACVPICPTRVFTLENPMAGLSVDTPACYGCGRCVPVCPTDALLLDPFLVRDDLKSVLSNPHVQAVEIHTQYADAFVLEQLYKDLGPWLKNKLISICLRPQTLQPDTVKTFLDMAQSYSPFPILIQIDGVPMSGSNDIESSLPALEAARRFYQIHGNTYSYLTVSGGINRHTALYLQQPQYAMVQGVGVGTVARQFVWDSLANPHQAQSRAAQFTAPFLHPQAAAV